MAFVYMYDVMRAMYDVVIVMCDVTRKLHKLLYSGVLYDVIVIMRMCIT